MSLENEFSQKKISFTIIANMLAGRKYRLLFEELFLELHFRIISDILDKMDNDEYFIF